MKFKIQERPFADILIESGDANDANGITKLSQNGDAIYLTPKTLRTLVEALQKIEKNAREK